MFRFLKFISIFYMSLAVMTGSVWALPSVSEMKNKFSNGPTYTDKEFEEMALKLRQQAIESTRAPRVETQPS